MSAAAPPCPWLACSCVARSMPPSVCENASNHHSAWPPPSSSLFFPLPALSQLPCVSDTVSRRGLARPESFDKSRARTLDGGFLGEYGPPPAAARGRMLAPSGPPLPPHLLWKVVVMYSRGSRVCGGRGASLVGTAQAPPLSLADASSRGGHSKVSDRNQEMVGQALCHVPPAEQLLVPGWVGGACPWAEASCYFLVFYSFYSKADFQGMRPKAQQENL